MDLAPLAMRTARKLERGLARNSLPAVADARDDLHVYARDCALGEQWADRLLRLLAQGVRAQQARRAALNGDSPLARSGLTATELAVFKALAGGFDTGVIAERFGKARSTVAMQSRCILARLGAVNIAHATAIGFMLGLVDERDLEAGAARTPRRRPNVIPSVRPREKPLLPEHEQRDDRARCRRGHELTPENTVTRRDGSRTCRACRRASSLAHYHRRRDDARTSNDSGYRAGRRAERLGDAPFCEPGQGALALRPGGRPGGSGGKRLRPDSV